MGKKKNLKLATFEVARAEPFGKKKKKKYIYIYVARERSNMHNIDRYVHYTVE